MATYYNPRRTPVNLSLADGSSILIGGHAKLDVAVVSASFRKAEAKKLLKRLPEPTPSSKAEQEVKPLAEGDQVVPIADTQIVPEKPTEAPQVESAFSMEAFEMSDPTASEETPSGDDPSEENESQTKQSSRRKKRSR